MALISVLKPMVPSAFLALVLWLPAPASASPSVTLSPSQGQAGDTFVISGRGFDAGEMVRITWDGSQLGGLVPADGDGAFTATRTVPEAAQPGGHMVEAADRPPNTNSASTIFTVSVSTTTTTSAPTTTSVPTSTTTTDAPTTTTETTDDGTADEKTTADGVSALDFTVSPVEVEPGDEIVVEADLTGAISYVRLRIAGASLGGLVVVEDGSITARRTVPDLNAGTHSVTLETPGGEFLGSAPIQVVRAGTTTTSALDPISEPTDRVSFFAWTVWAGILLLLLFWFLPWTRRSLDREEPDRAVPDDLEGGVEPDANEEE